MFKKWGTWLGIEKENGQEEASVVVVVKEDKNVDANPPTAVQPPQLLQQAQGFSGRFDKVVNFVELYLLNSRRGKIIYMRRYNTNVVNIQDRIT